MDDVLKKMNSQFFGTGKHKVSIKNFLEKENAIFLDVRTKEETETMSFNLKYFNIDVINIPINELPEKYIELSKDKFIGTFCSSGTRSAWAYMYLQSKGFTNVKWLDANNEELATLLKPGLIYKHKQ